MKYYGHHDGKILKVGQVTESGGIIINIAKDKNAAGNMFAQIGKDEVHVAISAIVIADNY